MVWGAVLVVAWLHICAAHTGPGGPACLSDLVWHNGQCFGRLDIGRVVRGSGRCGGQRDYQGLLSDYDLPDIPAVGGTPISGLLPCHRSESGCTLPGFCYDRNSCYMVKLMHGRVDL